MAVSAISQNKKVQEEGGWVRCPDPALQPGEQTPLCRVLQSRTGEAPGNYSVAAGLSGTGSEEARDRDWPAATEITIALVPLSGVRPWPCSGRRGRQTPGSLHRLTEGRCGGWGGGASSAG